MDNLLSSLSKYTVLLSPTGNKPVVDFGNSEKARLACETSFQLANRCGCCTGFKVPEIERWLLERAIPAARARPQCHDFCALSCMRGACTWQH